MTGAVDYVLVGHLSADVTADGGRTLGGTVSYAARVAHAFGLRIALVTSAAPDEPLLAELRPYVAELSILPAATTTSFENLYGPAGRTQYLRARAALITPIDIPRAWQDAPLVHIAPLANEMPGTIVQAFSQAKIMITPQGWLRQWDTNGLVRFRRWFDPDVLRAADIVVLSEEDIAADSGLEREYAATARCLVVTRGERPGTYYWNGQAHAFEVEPVDVADVTGAGDVFATSLLAAQRVLHGDMQAAVRVAAKLATRSVTRPGLAGIPAAHEIRQVLAEVQS